MKTIEMTGSPKDFGFKTKTSFMEKLEPFGYQQDKMKKRNNPVDILVTDNLDSTSNKMKLAKELDIEIMTYGELAELFDLEEDS
jgi:hypothetical protein